MLVRSCTSASTATYSEGSLHTSQATTFRRASKMTDASSEGWEGKEGRGGGGGGGVKHTRSTSSDIEGKAAHLAGVDDSEGNKDDRCGF